MKALRDFRRNFDFDLSECKQLQGSITTYKSWTRRLKSTWFNLKISLMLTLKTTGQGSVSLFISFTQRKKVTCMPHLANKWQLVSNNFITVNPYPASVSGGVINISCSTSSSSSSSVPDCRTPKLVTSL